MPIDIRALLLEAQFQTFLRLVPADHKIKSFNNIYTPRIFPSFNDYTNLGRETRLIVYVTSWDASYRRVTCLVHIRSIN